MIPVEKYIPMVQMSQVCINISLDMLEASDQKAFCCHHAMRILFQSILPSSKYSHISIMELVGELHLELHLATF